MSRSLPTADLEVLLERLGVSGPPTDLRKLAQARQVRRIVLRNMIPRGGLALCGDGFEVFIRDQRSREVSLDDTDAIAALDRRQRFTFAHELAHTFFFRLDRQPPEPIASATNNIDLEEACDRAAGQILVPSRSLRRFMSGREGLSPELAIEVADRFCVSIAVALNRLSTLADFDSSPIGVLLLDRHGAPEHRISAMFYNTGLRPFLPKPKRHQPLSDWAHLSRIEIPAAGTKTCIETREGLVELRRLTLGSTDERFLLEISGKHEA